MSHFPKKRVVKETQRIYASDNIQFFTIMSSDKNEFLPRYEKVNKIKIPKSFGGCLIVPPNDEGKITTNYSKDWDFVTIALTKTLFKEKLQGTNLSKLFIRPLKFALKSGHSKYQKKKNNSTQKNENSVDYQFCIYIVGVLKYTFGLGILLFALAIYINSDYELQLAIAGSIVILLSALSQLVVVHLSSKETNPIFVRFHKECQLRLELFFGQENETYTNLGLKWVIGKEFFWLELHVINKNV